MDTDTLSDNKTDKDSLAHSKEERFFFDQHIFDEDFEDEEELEDLPPPPPTFSEEELEGARKDGYDKGKQDGIKEMQESQEEAVAATMARISQHIHTLFESEEKRARTFEQEALSLTLAVFEKLFPLYHKKSGFEELKSSLQEILQKQNGPLEISVRVHPNTLDGVRDLLSDMESKGHEAHFDIIADEALSESGCVVNWTDGGAVRDIHKLADDIKNAVEKVLGKTGVVHSESGQDTDTNSPENDVSLKSSSDQDAHSAYAGIEAQDKDDSGEIDNKGDNPQ